MKTRDKLLLGIVASAGAAWGARAWLRHQRSIDLDGRVVIVTGGDSGFGFLLARGAALRGARIVLAARDEERLQEGAVELRRLGAPDVLVVPTDVTDPSQTERLASEAVARFGRIDVLLNNAGIITVGPLQNMDRGDFERALSTNFWGALNATLAVAPILRDQGFGRIGNVSSVGGRFVIPHLAPYTASKFALTGLTRALRAELSRDGILVTGIYPATIRTGGHTHAWFKGDREAEYAWFGLSDTLPGFSISAERAAEAALNAVCHGDPEVIIGLPARAAILADSLFSGWMDELNSLINRAMPAPANLGEPAVRGEDLQGTIPGLLNRLVPQTARPGE